MTRLRVVVFMAAAIGCARAATPGPAIPPRAQPSFPAGWRFQTGASATFAGNAMVVSNSRIASRVGAEVLRRGGNAVDAAVAVGFALAVTLPSAGNIGGGGFMVIRKHTGETYALDYREIAPRAATRDMYLDSAGKPTDKSLVGYLASGVPGSVAGMAEALSKHGTMTLAQIVAPAIALADSGWTVDSLGREDIRGDSALLTRSEGSRVFFPNGEAVRVGTLLRQPELAWSLRQIASRGPDAFYRGPIADSLVAEMRRGGGIMTHDDLRAYKPVWRTPILGTYRRHAIISMPPASSGGITMLEALNVLETYERPAPYGSTQWAHRFAETFQRAFIDRNAKLGDPAFVNVPQNELTSKAYARKLRASIDEERHTPTPRFTADANDGMHTTHYSVVDAQGNAVAVTTTLNGGYGSGVWVRGAGFFLNNEMDDFTTKPGEPNMFGLVQGEQNAIAPGKRMLSAMTPTIVLDPSGQVLLVLGGAGGPTIITGTTNVILNVIDHRMTLADAMRAPRLHHQALPDSLVWEKNGLSPAVADSLHAMGHGLRMRSSLVNMNAIMRVRGGWEGVSEPRSPGGAAGY